MTQHDWPQLHSSLSSHLCMALSCDSVTISVPKETRLAPAQQQNSMTSLKRPLQLPHSPILRQTESLDVLTGWPCSALTVHLQETSQSPLTAEWSS